MAHCWSLQEGASVCSLAASSSSSLSEYVPAGTSFDGTIFPWRISFSTSRGRFCRGRSSRKVTCRIAFLNPRVCSRIMAPAISLSRALAAIKEFFKVFLSMVTSFKAFRVAARSAV
ncbi:hypothetical protein V8G54_025066 [Vigna mungo]|uniref:Uncharacterized protein n=1 Tax=Vigna mungo TaxID=3915 RepID=A0AAQ3N6D6_VIGMU